MVSWIVVLVALFIIYCLGYCFWFRERPLSYKHLNGPSQIPFLGNLLDFNILQLCVDQLRWGRKYGPVYRVKIDRV